MDPAVVATVLDALTRAASQDTAILKPAEQQLKSWETQPGFYSVLLTIFSNHSLDVNVRWLAVVYFKNGLDRYWRKTASNAIPEPEKTKIREQLIMNFREPVGPIATQLAVLISKIARADCPRNWPELIPTLLANIRRPEHLEQQRALLTYHHVINMLAGKRLGPDRKLFQELTASTFAFLFELWNSHLEGFLHHASLDDHHNMAVLLELSTLALKVLRKQIIYGMTEPEKNTDAMMLIQLVFQRIRPVLEIRGKTPPSNNLREKMEKKILLMMKMLLDIQDTFPLSYVAFIPQSLELSVSYVFTEAGKGLLFERFIVQNMNLIKSIVKCDYYRVSKVIEETKEQGAIDAHKAKNEFFTDSTLREMCHRLLSQYFLLTQEDLEMWENDPEGFTIDEGGESWKFTLRPCTEVLFLAMFHAYRDVFTSVLLQMVQSVQGIVEPTNMEMMLQKEAVYNAMGLAAFELFDEVDFDQWFTNHLLGELGDKNPRYKIIRRRVIWLIGQWLGVKLAPSLHPTVYQAVLPLLAEDEDLVVRITAAQTLKIAVDDFEFKKDNFLPYLESSFALLFQLLKQVSECDTKMHILHVLSFIIERVEAQIRPYASSLAQYLPLLWEESSEHNMLRCAILSTLVHLVQGLGTLSVQLYPFLLPIIQFSTDVSQPPHVYLLDDGIDLWYETIQNAPTMTKELLQLFGNMPALLELGSENLKTCFQIITAYVLLGPNEFMQSYSGAVFAGCVSLLDNVRPEGIVIVMKLVETIFKMFPVEGPQIFRQVLQKVFQRILDKEEYPTVMSMYLSVIARIILKNQSFFFSFLQQYSHLTNEQPDEILSKLLVVWSEKMDWITQAERRKLSALALMALLPSNSRVVTEKFPDVIYAVVEVLHDVCREENGSQVDYLVMGDREDLEDEYETENDKRKRRLSLKDPVHCTSLRDYVILQFTEFERVHGTSTFTKLMESIDLEVRQQLERFFK
ncbi:importin-11-like [Patiria miniata]|uniref:Importin-11 n=1 Tax=Patiria miniata TaxID=46514 RepID=A0A914BKR2_PATMI|nr:importin-11-like [Patiria miniata]XP_038076377.1 importin-11-like [Patiria miniata]